MKKYFIATGRILLITLLSILLHIFLPDDGTEFDSILVKMFGFPLVATFYFLVLFTHLYMIMMYWIRKAEVSIKESAIKMGLTFFIIPWIAMMEVAPGAECSIQVTINQFFIGLCDALPVLGMAYLCYRVIKKEQGKKAKQDTDQKFTYTKKSAFIMGSIVAIGFIVVRLIGYYVGFIESTIREHTIPCITWTVVFGISLGIAIALLYSVLVTPHIKQRQLFGRVLVTYGINWTWFNCFIGLIAKGAFLEMALRGATDAVTVCICVAIGHQIIQHQAKH